MIMNTGNKGLGEFASLIGWSVLRGGLSLAWLSAVRSHCTVSSPEEETSELPRAHIHIQTAAAANIYLNIHARNENVQYSQ